MDEDQQYMLDALRARIPVSRPPSAPLPTGGAPQRVPSTPSPGGVPRAPVEVEANARGSVRVEARPDRVTATASGSVSADVNLRGPGGARGHVGVGAEGRVVADVRHEPGMMRYSLSGEVSGFVRADGAARGYGASFSGTERATARFEVAVPTNAPGNTDLRRVNPFDPSTMPVGTRVTMDTAQYSSREFNANLRYLSTRDRVNHEGGVSVAVEATGPDRVRVTAGPREAVDAYHGIGVNLGAVRAMAGRNDRLSGGTMRTAEFDLTNEAGRRAYGDFMARGTLPDRDNPNQGISGVGSVSRLDMASQTQFDIGVGRRNRSFATDPNTGSTVATVNGDGTSETRTTLRYGGSSDRLEIHHRYAADSGEPRRPVDSSYTFRVTPDQNQADRLNAAYGQTGGMFRAGQEATITFSGADIDRLRDMAARANQNIHGTDRVRGTGDSDFIHSLTAPERAGGTHGDFAIDMLRLRNSNTDLGAALDILSTRSGQEVPGRGSTTQMPLPGVVRSPADGSVVYRGPEQPASPQQSTPDQVPLSSPLHPSNSLYSAIRGRAPEGTSEDRLAQATLQAQQAGIRPDTLQSVSLQGNNLWVAGTIPGYRTNVDLSQPAPPAQETSARLHEQSATQAQTQTQDAARQGRPESEREQPVHTRH